jgi:predicted lipoprotein with Yx(FWY)xxD motif
VTTRDDPKLGTILTDSDGRTLYRFTQDISSQSMCVDQCAQAWPPFTVPDTPSLAPGIPGSLGFTTRADGVKQVMYNGHPLYYYAKDTKPGDTNGQGVGGKWFVVNPASMFGTPVASPAAG